MDSNVASYLPREHQGWFKWWCVANLELPLDKATVNLCLEAARKDGVITDKLRGHPAISDIRQFIGQKLKNIRKVLTKSVGFKV